MEHKKYHIVLIVIFLNVILASCSTEEKKVVLTADCEETVEKNESLQDMDQIYVYVSGAVKHPGVYEVTEDARVFQVIKMAGGMTDKAYGEDINLAETVHDGQEIHILSKKQHKADQSLSSLQTKEAEKVIDDKVNLNTATVQQLTELPGIGTTKATAIVAYRDENGNFSSIEDLKQVSGIGEATFSNIQSMITVN